jgi:hypothetical protein
MSKFEKERERIKLKSKNFTYTEAGNLLIQMGFVEYNKSEIFGLREKSYRKKD